MIDTTFDWYLEALKGNRGHIDADNPMAGFYRTRAGRDNKEFVPVAFWYDADSHQLRCHKNGKDVNDMAARELWPHASKNPVSSFMYWEKMDSGTWPDNDHFAAAMTNGPEINPEEDPVGSLTAEIVRALGGVDTYKVIETDGDASKAQTLRSALTTLSGKADKLRSAEKEPHLQASRDVDAKWQPLVKTAKEGADKIRTSLSKWEDFKREQSRKPTNVGTNAPAPSSQIKGGSGRTASVTVKKFITAIDISLAFEQFRESEEIYAVLMKLSQTALDAGLPVKGATIEERSIVR